MRPMRTYLVELADEVAIDVILDVFDVDGRRDHDETRDQVGHGERQDVDRRRGTRTRPVALRRSREDVQHDDVAAGAGDGQYAEEAEDEVELNGIARRVDRLAADAAVSGLVSGR